MKMLILLCCIATSGCTFFTVSNKTFPEAPPSLLISCPDLQRVEETDKASVLLSTVTSNYMQYHECRVRVEQWQYWYEEQRKNSK